MAMTSDFSSDLSFDFSSVFSSPLPPPFIDVVDDLMRPLEDGERTSTSVSLIDDEGYESVRITAKMDKQKMSGVVHVIFAPNDPFIDKFILVFGYRTTLRKELIRVCEGYDHRFDMRKLVAAFGSSCLKPCM
jgi:hypothetical protein